MGGLVALAAVLLFGSQAFFFFTMPAGRSFLPIAFVTIPVLVLASWLLWPQGAETFRKRLLGSIALGAAGSVFLAISTPDLGVSLPAILGFAALAACFVFAFASLAAAIESRWPDRSASLPCNAILLALMILPSWQGWGIAASPFAALSHLFQIDWIRDGELYFRVPSHAPLEYPDWRLYALAALAAGALLSWIAKAWRTR